MLTLLKLKLLRNWMMLLPISAAAATFFLNFTLKIVLNPEDYSDFASLFFLVTILFGLGIVGFDQIIVRYSKLVEDRLEVDLFVLKFGFIILGVTPLINYLFLSGLGVVIEFNLKYLVLSYALAVISTLVIMCNLQGRLVEAYLFQGIWKYVLLVLFYFIIFFSELKIDFIYLFILAISITLIMLLVKPRPYFFTVKNKIDLRLFFAFYFSSIASLLSFQFFDSLDRFLIISSFDKIVFGDYFFVYTFILSPLSIAVNYLSVKRLHSYKKSFSIKSLYKDYFLSLIITIVVGFFLIIALLIVRNIELITIENFDYDIIFMCYLLCVIRSSYIILSVSYRVIATTKTLFFVAILFLILSYVMYFYASNLMSKITLTYVVVIVAFLWFFRSVLYLILLKRDSSKLQEVANHE